MSESKEYIETVSQYVTFTIGDELYGVEVLKVHEIIGMTEIRSVPNSFNYMKGIINLRGRVVPVVDIRLKFNFDEREYDEYTVILIVEVKNQLVGMIVDSVSDVIGLPSGSIQATPHFSSDIDNDYIQGVGNDEDRMIIMLDVDRILSGEELKEISEKNLS